MSYDPEWILTGELAKSPPSGVPEKSRCQPGNGR